MSRLFNKIIIEDKKRIDGIKTILIDYFLAEKAKAMNHVKLIESSLEYIKCVDKEHDTNDFIKRFSHIQQTVSASSNTSLSQSPSPTPKTIKKSVSQPIINNKSNVLIDGVSSTDNIAFNFSESETFTIHSKELSELIFDDIVKCGKIYRPGRIIGSNWKEIYGNVSHFGWFHAFEKKSDLKSIVSIYLKGTNVNIKDNDKRNGLFTFEITVPNASWFSLTGTPTKYCYRVDNYEDCMQWISYLKQYVK